MSAHFPVPFTPDPQVPALIDPEEELRRNIRLGGAALAALMVALVLLAAVVRVAGAVLGSGEVAVESSLKRIAHPTGGVIAAVLVKDGDRVRAGQALLRLDTTVADVSANATGQTLEQLLATRARLEAERDARSSITFPAALTANPGDGSRAAMAEANHLFALRRQTLGAQRAQIAERIRQSEQQIGAYRAQLAAAHRQSALIEPERANIRTLYERQLVTIGRLNQLERTAVDLEGGAAALEAQIAQTRARIAELRQSAIQLEQDSRTQAGAELAEVMARIDDQEIRSVQATDTMDRSVLRAPQDGVVDKLAYTTVGGVLPAGQTVMEIVPTSDRAVVEAKIKLADVDQVHVGQPARLRFSAFNTQTTPELNGRVERVGASRTTDERTGASFYTVRVSIAAKELERLDGKLVPGMPVETYIQTGGRSLLSYVIKPLRDQLQRAFREG